MNLKNNTPVKIGITGASGFIGYHVTNYLSLYVDKYKIVEFHRNYFSEEKKLNQFVEECDVIIHLAGLNRHNSDEEIYDTNKALTLKLINALEKSSSNPHVIFASSSQEQKNNIYGSSKKEARESLAGWAAKNNAKFTGLIIPNVFGPFSQPFYNSVIATFSYQLVHEQVPVIEIDAELKLVYVQSIVKVIESLIQTNNGIIDEYTVTPEASLKVSDLLPMLISFNEQYVKQGIIPEINTPFQINLFNTFRSHIDLAVQFPFKHQVNKDDRGSFVELLHLNSGGQVSFSTTKPGITRGNHFHTRKIERFSVIKGRAKIQMRKINTSNIIEFNVNGDEPSFVDIPIWHTHNIINTGNEELYTIFWINEFFNPSDTDTFRENV